MNVTTLQGIQIGNPFTSPDTIYEIGPGVQIAPDPNTLIEIAPNCILRFTGNPISATTSSITLQGDNTLIEAGSYQIFNSKVNLSGSFTNAEWPAEWWGAKSDGTDAAPAINRALAFNNNFAYNSSSHRYNFIVNSSVDESGSEPVPEFGPGFDVEVETYVDN